MLKKSDRISSVVLDTSNLNQYYVSTLVLECGLKDVLTINMKNFFGGLKDQQSLGLIDTPYSL
jgi:hypothetical protein